MGSLGFNSGHAVLSIFNSEIKLIGSFLINRFIELYDTSFQLLEIKRTKSRKSSS